LFDQFLTDNPSWRTVFPTGELLDETFDRFKYNSFAHPPWTLTHAEVSTLLARLRTNMENMVLDSDIKKVFAALQLFERQTDQTDARPCEVTEEE
jgi:bifunctional DNase/RNase